MGMSLYDWEKLPRQERIDIYSEWNGGGGVYGVDDTEESWARAWVIHKMGFLEFSAAKSWNKLSEDSKDWLVGNIPFDRCQKIVSSFINRELTRSEVFEIRRRYVDAY